MPTRTMLDSTPQMSSCIKSSAASRPQGGDVNEELWAEIEQTKATLRSVIALLRDLQAEVAKLREIPTVQVKEERQS